MSRTDCGDGTNTFTPEPGEEINCTVTNYGGIPLQIDKDSYGGDGEFEFHLVNSSASFETNVQVVTTGSAGDGTGRGSGTLGLSNIGTYTITENDAPGWEESSNISCTVTHADHTTTDSAGSFTVGWNDEVSCFAFNLWLADVSLSKVVSGPTKVQPGGTTQYTFTVTNHDPDHWAMGLKLNDPMPQYLTATDTPTPGCSIASNTLKCDVMVAPGGTSTYVVNVKVADDAPTPVSLQNTATLTQIDITNNSFVSAGESAAVLGIVPTGSESQALALAALLSVLFGAALVFAGRRQMA